LSANEGFYGDRLLVIAHRGASGVAPENTLAAFQAALDADADGIELDITRCATGEIVVIHDDTLDRTSDGSGRVVETPFSALRDLDAGSWFAPRFAGQRIPTLEEVLDLVDHRLLVAVEIKGRDLRGTGLEAEVAEMVRSRGLQREVIISSFNPMALVRIRRAAPELQRGLICAPIRLAPFGGIAARWLVRPQALHLHHSQVDAGTLRRARRSGYRISVWTVNDARTMAEMIELGVDGIITNRPRRLRELLGSLPLASQAGAW